MSVDFSALAELDDLDFDAVEAVLAGGSEKGKYKEDLIEFVMSGKLGKPYKFSGKKAASVKTGLESAIKAVKDDANLDEETRTAAGNTVVRTRSVGEGDDKVDHVFLIREDLRRAQKAAAAA